MKNKHITILPNKFLYKKKYLLDLTFGCGGYTKNLLNTFNFNIIYSFDLSQVSYLISNKLYNKSFFFFKLKIKNIGKIIKRFNLLKIDFIIYDQGFNSFEIKNFYYNFKKKKYFKKKIIINILNLKYIFFEIINFFKKKFKLLILIFNLYEYYKIILFLKKIKKFKFKIIKPNKFEISLNNSIKNSLIYLIYVC
ncbi:16S rRNA (cytosine(1402)-N(4))-methyltransferase [Candidatus Carsonella ruddii]|uniref:Putative S-adenosyl-methyltransferase MraW n=1 Tax=Candidatus Carsonella ruddii PC isolate NHV TaxID=1202540 RepID=J3Z1Y7_CARRU|nr:16S rRNA (cytosine(1402)-N(4))-methyltransferase [Candidatus Carsonella ruddii]AFP84274.1 putative S-adenosyl-methyltransferase MraW [Candidatus Carsonella ruddii PC isolate NHV]